MWITPAFAQASAPALGTDFSVFLMPVLIIAIFYFLVFRPQQRRAKQHQEMLKNLRRGDTVVTAGGIVGKIARVVEDSNEVELDIADKIRVRVVRSMISEVRVKGEPVKEGA